MPISDCYDSIRTIASYTRTNLTTNLPAQRRFDRILASADGLLDGHYAKLKPSYEPLTPAFLSAVGAVNDSIINGASAPGGWSVIGENGPELMNVPKGARILPNGQMPEGGISAPVSIHIDATGADAAGLARVEAQLARLRTELPSTIVTTVKKAQTNRVL